MVALEPAVLDPRGIVGDEAAAAGAGGAADAAAAAGAGQGTLVTGAVAGPLVKGRRFRQQDARNPMDSLAEPGDLVITLGYDMVEYPPRLWNPEGNPIFLAELKRKLRQDIPIIEIDAHINDDEFANAAFEQLLEVMGKTR